VPELSDAVRTVARSTTATPDEVFAVLADGWSYATWVVGASRVRDVEPSWPAPGTRIHHSFGMWPAVIEATVDITLHPEGTGCRVEIREDATAGPGRLVPLPVRQLGIVPRNVEALRRLCLVAEGRANKG
jgi:hypothetical protein